MNSISAVLLLTLIALLFGSQQTKQLPLDEVESDLTQLFNSLTLNVPAAYQKSTDNLLIGSFNIQTLGPTKMSRPEFVEVVVGILSKYDIILIQEIRDSSANLKVVNDLLKSLNQYVKENGLTYAYALSPRLGFTSYKEQYAAFYRSVNDRQGRTIRVQNQYVYADPQKIFDRPPHMVSFRLVRNSSSPKPLTQFTLANVHLRPTQVLNESLELRQVIDSYLTLYPAIPDFAIMGDFNLDCSYVKKADLDAIRKKLNDMTWYISDGVATTISSKSCAYDRILVRGEAFNKAIVPSSNVTYYYESDFGLTPEEVKKISDHYPVEFQVK